MRVILCGYHWTGCKALELLLDDHHEIYVYTHKSENCVPDLEEYCRKRGVEYSLDKISVDNLPFIPDIICSIYYRYIIPKNVIDVVHNKIFNLHPALLPKYRGCSSLTWAMINGDKECGYTYHYIDESCDTGDIIIQKSLGIEEYDTQLTLYNRVMFESMKDFLQAFYSVVNEMDGIKQNGEASYYERGCPYNGIIQNDFDDEFAERFIRAMLYPPYKAAIYKGQEVKTFSEYKSIREKEK